LPDALHSFYDDFQYKGVWWLPGSPGHRFSGVLTRHINDNRVEFFGTDADLFPSLEPGFLMQIILGHLENGML